MADNRAAVLAEFKKYDKDGTGILDHNEVKAAMKDVCSAIDLRLSDADIDVLIKRVDKNNDGKVNIEEFAQLI